MTAGVRKGAKSPKGIERFNSPEQRPKMWGRGGDIHVRNSRMREHGGKDRAGVMGMGND